jgi:hypothetical protein
MDDLIFEDFTNFTVSRGVKARLEAKARVNGCASCKRRAPPYVAGYGRGNFIALCLECTDVDPPVSVIRDGRSGPVWLSIETPWIIDDLRWFKAHPHRRLRLRAPFPCEMRTLGFKDAVHIVVEKRGPGTFLRALGNFGTVPDDDEGLEALLDSYPAPVTRNGEMQLAPPSKEWLS